MDRYLSPSILQLGLFCYKIAPAKKEVEMGRFADRKLVAEALSRAVTLRSKASSKARKYRQSKASGFIYQTGYVITNEHLEDLDVEIRLNGHAGKVKYKHPEYDLLLIEIETPKMLPLIFSSDYEVADDVIYAGSPGKNLEGFIGCGHIGKINEKHIWTNTPAIAGVSGSLIWHVSTEKPIGVIYECLGDSIAKAYSAKVVDSFVKMALCSKNGNLKLPL